MAAQKQKRAIPAGTHKRHGRHHKQGNRYLKVYFPYVPIIAIVAIGLFIGQDRPAHPNGVLAYATEMNINTLLNSTNQKRTAQGAKPLQLNKQLSAAAQAKANDMTARNYWSHISPDGKEPWTFIDSAGYAYQKAGENLAYGFNSSAETVAGWMNSPSHRENLLDESYTEVGFGFANARNYTGNGPETVVVALYGRPESAGAYKTPVIRTSTAAVTSDKPLVDEPTTLGIARIQTLTGGYAPWALLAVGMLCGLLVTLFAVRHGRALHRLIVRGESFIIHHPILDVVIVALVMTGYVLSRTSGVIR